MKILKWELNDSQELFLPKGAKILDVQIQKDTCCLWALCDENATREKRVFAIYGTGNPIPDDPGTYISTFQMYNGNLVFHVFEIH